MDDNRRDFLKWLSITPLLAASACSTRKTTAQPDRLPIKTTPSNPGKPAPTGASAGKAVDYATDQDKLRMRKTRGYGSGLPANPECPLTAPDVLGPFHRPGAPKRTVIAGPKEPGKRLAISGRVLHHDCKTPVAGALLDIWQADAKGRYDNDSANYRLRAQVTTDAQGRYAFETIQPGHYPLGNSMRPAHIHFTVSYPGCHPLTTQLYFKGDRYLKPNDPCGICNSGDGTLIIALTPSGTGTKAVWAGTFDIVLAKA